MVSEGWVVRGVVRVVGGEGGGEWWVVRGVVRGVGGEGW